MNYKCNDLDYTYNRSAEKYEDNSEVLDLSTKDKTRESNGKGSFCFS